MENNLCECCGENPVWAEAEANGYAHCEACSMTESCSVCDRNLSEPARLWEHVECEDCTRRGAVSAWMDNAVEAVEAAAKALGLDGPYYEGRRGWHYAVETTSRYAQFDREDEEGDNIGGLSIRVSDHAGKGGVDISLIFGEIEIEEIAGRMREELAKQ